MTSSMPSIQTAADKPLHLSRRGFLHTASVTSVAAALGSPVFAQAAWPSRPVVIVSPYSPGGTNDVVARLVADRLQKATGQPFVVENRAGAAGVLGVQSVIRAKPDGYTLLSSNNGCIVIQAAGRNPSPYDPEKQLTPVMKVADAMQFIAVSSDLPVKTVGDLIALAKSKPGTLNFTSSGVGSFGHFMGEYLKLKAGIDMVHVPSKGSAAGVTELMAHRIQVMIDPQVLSQASDHRIRILASVSPRRLTAYPDYPTLEESGGPSLDLSGWFGLHGPAGLPPDVVLRLEAVGQKMQDDEEVQKIFQSAGLMSSFSRQQPFGALIQNDLKRVAEIRERAGIQIS